ncbi:MAG: DNA polymerase III subunit epsilon [Alphaproteobacteria bacterium]|nr:DNA polymerase III subunit epsilon [Alphaproteobacteria bacterium]MDE2109633.1 DNA polymerase III subunit epsilon [Alphaproteobacteria bacterium]MDE2493053.1 DNA polymerase III subunit epsilon [Alphaproteobacteria bacterium]
MREIVLDTETTGFDPSDGHRIVEIGCVELMDHFPTGKTFQCYLNPDRDMPAEAERVHGITGAFLADKPRFPEIAERFLEFIGDAPLIIHNASFDLKFINAELDRIGGKPVPAARAIDTIEMAKSKLPGARYSLDELCKRFGIDLSVREKHGALLDAELTAQVYLELIGGRQKRLLLAPADDAAAAAADDNRPVRVRPTPLAPLLTAAEREAHAAFVSKELGEGAVWNWGTP